MLFFGAAIGHAVWHYRKEVMLEHATLIAEKMAEKMKSKKTDVLLIINDTK